MTTNEMTCDTAADKGRGLHYQSHAWASIAEDAEWTGMWPAIDRDGKLTGQAVDSDETAVGWLNVDDEAMISVEEARVGGWTIDADEGRAEPPKPVIVEFAVADETIRDRGGIDEFAGLEHTHMAEACAAYRSAAIAALEDDPRAGRLVAESPRGQRILHSAWAGAHWSYSSGAIGAMADLTADEKAAVSAADNAGREAARKVIAEADAVEVEVCHASSIPGARWCRPVGWSPRNAIDGAEWSDGDGAWHDENGDAAGIVVYGDHAEGDRVTVALDDLRVASCGDCRVVGEVEVA
jgi:hypothetical protein